ncbi:5-deoxy-glucuronate isomerase [Scleromatobacter humisilvae]|uniref:5-deoxy-glucuronate isomerase n=1 Tax=Scleromatobacter humisilvae TaxID=2897159 RepID=A0A9X1YJU0_9BURK|nr:5-deoxy-glucuronate isomerase [Scleromatobacter humisilvae]MCK9687488.1 5-deoxy-glucuronate isomerase [Scleromatobacter humisilvae]
MTSKLLLKARREGREIVSVTPEQAGWKHVGFRALRLAPGDAESLATGDRELCLVVLSGTVDVEVDGVVHAGLGGRASVFDDAAPAALYVPAGRAVTMTASTAAEVALCSAPADDARREVRRIEPGTMRRSVRGRGTNTRYICDILPHDDPTAAHLLVVEVRTPASHSSSYPPHKHDVEAPPAETQLEETYYHRVNPPQGFAFQRVYTDDRSLDEACAVEDHDLVMVPRGYHPVVAPHGYELYYLNVMAGPHRLWVFRNDPAHEWMLAPPAGTRAA